MKKKLLTVVLAATMVISSVTCAFATNNSAGTDSELETNNSAGTDSNVEEVIEITDSQAKEIAANTVVAGAEEGVVIVVNAPAAEEARKVLSAAENIVALKDTKVFVLDLKLEKEGNAAQVADGKRVKVTLPVFEGIEGASYVSVFRLDGDKLIDLGAVEVKDGKFTFETDHFSTYVFAKADAARTSSLDTTTDDNNGKQDVPGTGDSAPVAIIAVLAVVALGTVVVLSVKKKNA